MTPESDSGIDSDLNLAQWQLTGVLDDATFIAQIKAVITHPDYRVGMNSLLDFRQVTELKITSVSVQTIASTVRRDLDSAAVPWRTAIVAPQALAYKFSRIYQILRERSPGQVKVFRDLAAAWAWLDLPPERMPR